MTRKYVFLLSIFSFILTAIWIASNVYHSYATTTIEPLLQIQIQEISPTFDDEALADLKKRTVIQPSDGSVFQPTISEIASEEAVIEEFPEETPQQIDSPETENDIPEEPIQDIPVEQPTAEEQI